MLGEGFKAQGFELLSCGFLCTGNVPTFFKCQSVSFCNAFLMCGLVVCSKTEWPSFVCHVDLMGIDISVRLILLQ